MSAPLTIPDIADDQGIARAAVLYATAGWFVGPLRLIGKHKHAGSILGKGWPDKTSNDPRQVVRWFARKDHDGRIVDRLHRGVFLHVGRSGAIAFDVDAPEHMSDVLRDVIRELRPPFQATRRRCCPPFDPYAEPFGRGHYVFALPPGVVLGNRLGALATDPGWGQVRGTNGIIVAQPTPHANADDGGCYRWWRPGVLPELSAEIVKALLYRPTPRINPRQRYGSIEQLSGRLHGVLTKVSTAVEGERNLLLFWGACRCAEIVDDGLLDQEMIYDTLVDLGMSLDLDENEVTATVGSGLGIGGSL